MNDIEILEWVCINKLYIDTHNECDYHNIHTAIENLIQRNKDLEQIEKEHKEENGRLRDRIKELEIEKENEFKRGFFTKVNESHKHTIKIESQVIPIFKIEKKIEELTKIKGDLATYIATSERIKVLQELLEESDK